ncbi:hypothetical protein cce_0725 [Crocosphaera subtropica ATCC 51142]|uniref:Uncharacterized protein n=1 Tax=Crocosphaera subtropica (strain ATCC 51142 / BH68) TaxID=43989 RepID=B1WR18_CROS5|nr:hypothetical protein cce_0725 [Crocosphaera subtropica ATCC 51142]
MISKIYGERQMVKIHFTKKVICSIFFSSKQQMMRSHGLTSMMR